MRTKELSALVIVLALGCSRGTSSQYELPPSTPTQQSEPIASAAPEPLEPRPIHRCLSAKGTEPRAMVYYPERVPSADSPQRFPETRWSRNLAEHPQVAVHLESGDNVVILEGTVERISDPADPPVTRIDDAYEAKYQMRHGVPFWVLRPRLAFAWSKFPDNATRWRFS